MKDTLPWILILCSCGGVQQTPSAADQASIAAEQAEQTLCVEQNKTQVDIDACRAKIKAKYNIIFGDGGGT